ncbi:hypothetical protein BHM03_00053380, partial [Ensete ventricosum]
LSNRVVSTLLPLIPNRRPLSAKPLRPPPVTIAALVNRDFLYKQSSALLSSLSNDSTSHTTTNLSAERTLKSHYPSLRCPQPAPPLQLRPSVLPHSRVSPSTTEAKQSSHCAHHL